MLNPMQKKPSKSQQSSQNIITPQWAFAPKAPFLSSPWGIILVAMSTCR